MIKTNHFEYAEYPSVAELPSEDQSLLLQAKEAASRAYAPYSEFRVGAALLLENGVVVTGNNQENAAYPSGLCAERVALFYASAQYPGVSFKTLAITADSDKFEINHPITPCGSCRQVMLEYEALAKDNIKVILAGKTGVVYVINSVKDLLPLSFGAEELQGS